MADGKDKNYYPGNNVPDEEFDYQKEMEEIEALERELAARRARRQKLHQERLEKEAAREKSSVKENSQKARREAARKEKELKQESEWLGEPIEGEEEVTAKVVRPASSGKKKKNHAGLAVAVALLLLAALGGGAFAVKTQVDKKTVSDFQAKVASFQTEKLDGADLGNKAQYFDEFIAECNKAIQSGDLAKIKEIKGKWPEIEKELAEVENGKASIDAFVKTANDTLSKYKATADTKEQYDKFVKDLKKAQEENDYTQIESLTKDLEKLETALKASDIKEAQELKNKVADLEIDKDYVTDEQKKELDEYKEKVEAAEKENDYAAAIEALNDWNDSAQGISTDIEQQKKESTAKASSQAAAAQSQAQAEQYKRQAAESTAQSIAESKQKTSSGSSTSRPKGDYASLTADYVFPDSSSRYISVSELKGLTSTQLMVARNEIYARHGRKFDDKGLRDYFNSKSWYKGTVDPDKFSVSVFNKYEAQNIMTIREYEN